MFLAAEDVSYGAASGEFSGTFCFFSVPDCTGGKRAPLSIGSLLAPAYLFSADRKVA